ncbi:MAG TPA: response regulator transcription factor [Anaerolineae bacterium]|nr:response regulator transcription factor [Anaerolineae bacterium]HOQ99318.1 response regulator transcription factor [Anaerolineae bacterium]HPL27664.1 response regulator transcription factor [Anaerolineae bacterium]
MRHKILVIDDDRSFLEAIKQAFLTDNYELMTASSGRDGLQQALAFHPDLIILDVMMPEMDGWEVCRRLRELTNIPLMFLTAKEGEDNIVRGLLLGGDDYLAKPVRVAELRARVDALLRRADAGRPSFHVPAYDDGELYVDLTQPRVLLRGRLLDLTPQEYRVLAILAQNAGQVVTYGELLRRAWGPDLANMEGYVHLYVCYLRGKLEDDPAQPRRILNKRGVGYILERPK